MRHYKARSRSTDGRYDYTVSTKEGARPVGYCTGWDPFTERQLGVVFHSKEELDKANAEMAVHKDKYHTDGHANEQEACECYKQYLLDNNLRLDGHTLSDQQLRCEICGEFTQGMVIIAGKYNHFILCDEHRTRECVEKLLTIGESWES